MLLKFHRCVIALGYTETGSGTPDEIPAVPVPTQELGVNCVGVSLSLPRSSSMAQGKVVKRSCDNDGNVVGYANENPILDTQEYVVEFEDGE